MKQKINLLDQTELYASISPQYIIRIWIFCAAMMLIVFFGLNLILRNINYNLIYINNKKTQMLEKIHEPHLDAEKKIQKLNIPKVSIKEANEAVERWGVLSNVSINPENLESIINDKNDSVEIQEAIISDNSMILRGTYQKEGDINFRLNLILESVDTSYYLKSFSTDENSFIITFERLQSE